MNMRPVAYLYTYKGDDGKEFTVPEPIAAVPIRVTHLYTADQVAMAQEMVKIEAMLIVKHTINGDVYCDQIKKIKTLAI